MIPSRPRLKEALGFLYCHPWRIQGTSIAGEGTVIQIPELDVVFDMGSCPRIALSSPLVAISHGHMDHVGGLPYWFSQRVFQKMGVGKCVCPKRLERPLINMMASWVPIEHQETPFQIHGLEDLEEVDLKPNIKLRALETSHAAASLGFAAIEYRSKLRPDLAGESQSALRKRRECGENITMQLEIPLVAYTGDTESCATLFRDEFCKSRVVIAECTFYDPDHRSRAAIGKHLHVQDLPELLNVWEAEHVVLIHGTRRTPIEQARQILESTIGEEEFERVHMLMDHRRTRARYEQQVEAARPQEEPIDGSLVDP
mgnify:CR=1 FL=1